MNLDSTLKRKEVIVMGIRPVKIEDHNRISELLEQLGYPGTAPFIAEKIARMIDSPDEYLLVYEIEGVVQALISLHFIPQVALPGDFARISYFIIDERFRGQGVGKEMLEHCIDLAKQRRCDRFEVHSHSRRTGAHRFYAREGFEESPKYLIKILE